MGSGSRERIVEVFDALDAELDRLAEVSFEVLTTPERLRSLERLECLVRRLPAVGHTLINQLDTQASEEELGGTLCCALANRLRITKPDAARRIADAADLGPRRALTGEPLAPQLTATATAQRQGLIGEAHVKVIRALFRPPARRGGCVHPPGRRSRPGRQSRSISSRRAGPLRPAGHGLATPDGDLTDTERARKRGITLSNQQYDGMSRLSGYLTPQARATFEAVLAKLAAPGATNPDDHTPVIDTTPDAAAIDRDTRSQAQRNHDGLLAGLRALIASGKLGQHNGLPVSIVVTTTLTDLQTGAGKGFTGGGTLLPMADVIRMTSHAHHYSPASGRYPQAIFDHGTPLALYHTKRLASPAQRIMLFANDRGCTKPGCDAPAYHSQAHHVTAWTSTGRTDITELTLACGPDNRLAEKGWTTHNNTHGHTEWLPPPHLDHGQPRTNTFHHPERFLHNQDDDDEPD
ncbi:HNH endonuclease signature motif containing protein [Mycobacterium tuberculosis]